MTEIADAPDQALLSGRSRPLHILTSVLGLAPIGGIETSTLQDSVALTRRRNSVTVLHGGDGPDRSNYEAAGIPVEGPFSFGFSPRTALRDLVSFLRPAMRARRLRPDVFWLNRPEHIVWAQVVSRISGTPIVVHLHHAPNYMRARLLYSGVAHFIAVSGHARDLWVRRGIDADRITVVHNAIATSGYPRGGAVESAAARERLGLPADIPIVMYYGRISEDKGVVVLVEAWRRLGLQPQQARLVLVGDPDPSKSDVLADALAALPTGSWAWFPTTSDIVPLLHAADLTVLPSLEHETFGRVLIETMATGRPAIGSRVGGVPEVLSGPMARFLVEPGDPADLAGRMSELIDWRSRQPGLADECHEWVVRRFRYDDHLVAVERILAAHRRERAPRQSRRRARRGSRYAKDEVTAYSGRSSPSRSADGRP
jgi:glycosyltransferase involved in cell wall biosynthesis